MKWTARQKARIDECFGAWLDAFFLTPITISYVWETKNEEKRGTSGDCAFEITSGYPYRSVLLTIYPVAAEMSDEQLDACLCHEAIHAVLVPMQRNREAPWEYFRDNLEIVTDHLSHIILKGQRRRKDLEKRLKGRRV